MLSSFITGADVHGGLGSGGPAETHACNWWVWPAPDKMMAKQHNRTWREGQGNWGQLADVVCRPCRINPPAKREQTPTADCSNNTGRQTKRKELRFQLKDPCVSSRWANTDCLSDRD